MPNIFDFALILIFLASVIYGISKGFVKSIMGILAAIVSFYLAYTLSPILAPKIYDMFFSQRVTEAIQAQISQSSSSVDIAAQALAVINSLPKFLVSLANSIGLGVEEIGEKISSAGKGGEDLAIHLANSVAHPVATAVLQVVLFIVLLFVLRLSLLVLIRVIDKIFDLPVLKSANKLLGGLLGVFKGLFAVYVICLLAGLFVGREPSNAITQAFDNSKILQIVSENNIIAKAFGL
ncbi:MAG TPA: CvpA family protein [Clostridiales bacterium]|nr:CvpA family protein [Clostridiales bacterium]HRT82553.1 CvpA family protein [Oscillospiraceae bacterium]